MKENRTIYKTMFTFFTKNDWPLVTVEELGVINVPFKGKNSEWFCTAMAKEDIDQFAFYSILPFVIPGEKRFIVSEFLTRANYGQIIGSWEMNLDTGEVRYKTSLDVEGDRISESLIKQAVHANVVITDQYVPGIIQLLESEISPKEAISLVEYNLRNFF
jgi:hypothetical protein